jgi:hypothetical protein
VIEQLIASVTVKDLGVVVAAAVSTYFVAREARREAVAANRRIDAILKGRDDRDGDRERITRLEEGRKTDRVELLRVRDNAHLAVNIGSALTGYTDNALDIVSEAVGRPLPHPTLKLSLPKPQQDEGSNGA